MHTVAYNSLDVSFDVEDLKMQIEQNQQVSSPYLMIMLMTVMSVAILGMVALANGYIPFSPSFFISYPLSAASCYLLVLGMCYRFEVSDSPYSARPYLEEDPQSFFNVYLLIAIVWTIGVIPVFWLKMGHLALQGASIDEMVYQNHFLCLLVCLGGGFSYFLRKKAVEHKDIYRVNRLSPIVQQSTLHIDIPPGWNHSDIWDVVSVSEEELQAVSDRDRRHYELRREEKLKKETQEVEVFRANRISDIFASRATQNKTQDLKDDQVSAKGIDSQTHMGDSAILPSWLSKDNHSKYDYPESSVRRSIGDFDTRFEQSIIPAHEVLADNISWSGVSRPAHKPRVSSASQEELMSEDISDCPTSPPLEINADKNSEKMEYTPSRSSESQLSHSPKTNDSGLNFSHQLKAESLEDQILFEQVLEVIADTDVHIDLYDTQNRLENVKCMSFNSLDEVQDSQQTYVAFGAIDLESQ